MAVGEEVEAARRRRGSSRARSPRRSAGGGGPSRPRRPRRSASSARRSPRTSSPRRSPSSHWASMSVSQSSGQPMCSVPSPRWLCVATGTASKMRSISSSEKPSSSRRSRERAWTSVCAHGHAVMPWARTPISRRVPASLRHGGAEQRVDLLRLDARDAAPACAPGSAPRCGPRRGARPGGRGPSRRCAAASVSARKRALAEHDLADRVVDDLLEAAHVRALLVRAEVDEAVEAGGEQLLGAVGADPDDLLDVGHAHARERDEQRREPGSGRPRGQISTSTPKASARRPELDE